MRIRLLRDWDKFEAGARLIVKDDVGRFLLNAQYAEQDMQAPRPRTHKSARDSTHSITGDGEGQQSTPSPFGRIG